jgi:hypothetical protein
MTPRQWQLLVKMEHDVGYDHPKSGCLLELHWRASWDTLEITANRWAKCLPVTRLGCTYSAMDPANLALYLANHGGEPAWFRAKWLGDIARLYTNGVDWEQVWDWSSSRDSGDATITTGSKAVESRADSTNSPRLKARRHANTWFAFTPLISATFATLAPDSRLCSTIRRFSAIERRRLPRCPPPISSA